MNKGDHLQRHFELCKRIYLRMLAEGSWPWDLDADSNIGADTDSQNPENLIESEDLTSTL